MATTKDFVTSLQDQYVEGVRRSQQAVVEALNLWTESIGRVAPDLSSKAGSLPSAEEVIDNTFDFAENLLGAQREFAKSLLRATVSGVEEAQAKAEPERPARKTSR